MFKRSILTGLAILLLLLLYLLSLLPVLAVRLDLESRHFAFALLVWGVLAGSFLVPALALILKKIWFFQGQGEPVVLDLLQGMLLGINDMDCPVAARKKGRKIIITWRAHDPQWCERFAEKGMKRLYELWLTFDNHTKTVRATDRHRSVNWDLCPISIKTGWFSYSRPLFGINLGAEWGVENYRDTPAEEYSCSPAEIKSPVVNTILKNGWNVRFTLF
jgi:hypothetical protein